MSIITLFRFEAEHSIAAQCTATVCWLRGRLSNGDYERWLAQMKNCYFFSFCICWFSNKNFHKNAIHKWARMNGNECEKLTARWQIESNATVVWLSSVFFVVASSASFLDICFTSGCLIVINRRITVPIVPIWKLLIGIAALFSAIVERIVRCIPDGIVFLANCFIRDCLKATLLICWSWREAHGNELSLINRLCRINTCQPNSHPYFNRFIRQPVEIQSVHAN